MLGGHSRYSPHHRTRYAMVARVRPHQQETWDGSLGLQIL